VVFNGNFIGSRVTSPLLFAVWLTIDRAAQAVKEPVTVSNEAGMPLEQTG